MKCIFKLKIRGFILGAFMISTLTNISYGQIDVTVGLYINDIILSKNDGTFYADFYWWSKVPRSVDEEIAEDMYKLDFVNATNNIENELNQKLYLDSFYYYQGHCKGIFNYLYDYRRYPFDYQNLPIIMESINLSEETVILKADEMAYDDSVYKGMNEEISFNDFKLLSANFESKSKIYKTSFGDPNYKISSNYSRLTYNVNIKRAYKSYLLKIIIPCFILAVIAYLVFFIPAHSLEVAVGCTVTSLLACIALQLTTANDIPNIGYLTVSNKIYYLFYVMITLALIQTVYTYNLENKGKIKLAYNLEIAGRYLYPVLLLIGFLLILLI